MNITDINQYIADMPSEVLDFLGVDTAGRRISRTILHPVAHDRMIFEMILDAEMINLPMLVRKTNIEKTQVNRALTYLIDSGLVIVEGVRQSRMFFPAPGANPDSELPEVKAKQKGKPKKVVVVDDAQSA